MPYRLLYFSTVTPSCVLCLLRLCLFSFHIALKLCPFVPLSFQECPSGVVNEDTFKQIYSQFFPHGGEVCVCVCAVMFAFMFVFVSARFPASVLATFFFFSCRCQHLRALPVQCIWHRTHRIHKVWGLLYTHSFPIITSQLFDTHLPYASLIQFVILYLLRSPSGLCNSSVHPAERFCHREATVDF